MESVYSKQSNCCGCSACYSACPVGAIEMQPDEKGFLYPIINQEKCINCKKCQSVCPLNKEIKKLNNQKLYATKNKNLKERITSSSGGFFCELSKLIIKNKGIVYGAAYNENNEVIHIAINSFKEISRLKGSKYVQSNNKGIYIDVREKLDEGKLVLFSGTPCQIYGLKTFLKREYQNLITCDIVCHGVPSPKIFECHKLYLERKHKSRIENINFRFKNKDTTQNMNVIFKNQKQYLRKPNKDDYYFLFSKNFILRESCFKCHFSNMNRVSDITIGDFWGIENTHPEFYDFNGISLVILNTKNGEKYFNKIKSNFEYIECNTSDCLQPNLISPSKEPYGYKEFWSKYNKNGYISAKRVAKFKYFITRIKNKVKKIGR